MAAFQEFQVVYGDREETDARLKISGGNLSELWYTVFIDVCRFHIRHPGSKKERPHL